MLIRLHLQINKLIPATRAADGSHVMIQLVCKGDEGHSELAILRYFNKQDLRCHPENHVIPLLDIIEHLDMVFVVTPLLSSGSYNDPWFYDYSEALDAMQQSFEVSLA